MRDDVLLHQDDAAEAWISVCSDDERIAAKLDASHRSSENLQIITLSCRLRAFRELAARRVTIERTHRDQ
ncbi:hypothetical protein [Palleronia rufa]|uniref:hypothetical protein n=1 Tax=Palleronia rufa TaxID=1530186 RepID=UPI00056839CB|nr:hypothetical protein [Palleronia rufa]